MSRNLWNEKIADLNEASAPILSLRFDGRLQENNSSVHLPSQEGLVPIDLHREKKSFG
jgi:hypothetical protein